MAVNWSVPPTIVPPSAGWIVSPKSAGGWTVRFADPLTDPTVARIDAPPAARPWTSPNELTLATCGEVELHAADVDTSFVLPSEKVAVAVNRAFVPTGLVAVWGETAIEVICGTPTVNGTPLLASRLDAVTTTLPVVAPWGTATEILVSLQLAGVTVALTPLNVTPPKPGDAPNPFPVIATCVPIGAVLGVRLPIFGTIGK